MRMETSICIEASKFRVWEVLSDIENISLWSNAVISAKPTAMREVLVSHAPASYKMIPRSLNDGSIGVIMNPIPTKVLTYLSCVPHRIRGL